MSESREVADAVHAEEFVRIWESSDTLDEVVRRTGLKRSSASQRASTLRSKYDIPLKRMSPVIPHALTREGLMEAYRSAQTGGEEPEVEKQGFEVAEDPEYG